MMMQSLQDHARHIKNKYSLPKLKIVVLSVGVFLFGAIYTASLLYERPVAFSYAHPQTCTRKLTLLPAVQLQTKGDAISVVHAGMIKLGKVPVASSKLCFKANTTPKPGKVTVQTALFGLMGLHTTYTVTTKPLPVVDASVFRTAIASSKPLEFRLSKPDRLFTYSLHTRAKRAQCEAKETTLQCDTAALGLHQSRQYDLQLHRKYGSAKTTLAKAKVVTLPAVGVRSSSVPKGGVIFAKPRVFSVTTNKSLSSAKLKLLDKNNKEIDLATSVAGKVITGKIHKDLSRESKYVLVLDRADATDGSTLEAPKKLPFYTSGGPIVKSINIGSYNVSGSALITLQFDQPINGAVDVSKYVSLTGGASTISRGASSISIQLHAIGRCKSFAVSVKAGMTSKYDIKTTKDWSHQSRTTCQATSVYGISLKGRALTAYYFGSNGATTMYVGAIHGNEVSSSGLMKAWIDYLEAHPNLYTKRRIVVVPTINPDGVAAGSRTNSRGVNLNRNFPTNNWVKDINDTDGKHKGGGGSKPLSEPEAAALARLTTSTRPRLLLSFHAVGSLVVGDVGSSSARYASLYAAMVGYRNATGQSSNTFDYSITGAYEDWTYRNQAIPSMVIELGDYSYYNFSHHQSALEKMLY